MSERTGSLPKRWHGISPLPNKNPAAVALGKLGGASKSRKKQAASRKNGKLGGRPADV